MWGLGGAGKQPWEGLTLEGKSQTARRPGLLRGSPLLSCFRGTGAPGFTVCAVKLACSCDLGNTDHQAWLRLLWPHLGPPVLAWALMLVPSPNRPSARHSYALAQSTTGARFCLGWPLVPICGLILPTPYTCPFPLAGVKDLSRGAHVLLFLP